MKLAIIAAAIIASSSAVAATPGVMVFEMQAIPSCSLDVVTPKAIISYMDESRNDDNFAKAVITSDLATVAKVTMDTNWKDLSPWNGIEPGLVMTLAIDNTRDGDVTETFEKMNATFDYKLTANQDHALYLGAEVKERATHSGSALLETIIKVECE